MVVHMLVKRLADTPDGVVQLFHAVEYHVEPGAFPQSFLRFDMPQAEGFLSSEILETHLFLLQVVRTFPQDLDVFFEQPVGDVLVFAGHVIEEA